MTLLTYLRALKCRPDDDTSPGLLVAEDDITTWDKETITASPYSRSPYVIVEGLPSPAIGLADKVALVTGGVDVSILKMAPSDGSQPTDDDRTAVAKVAAHVVAAPFHVTELETDYPLFGLQLVSDPRPRLASLDVFSGLIATARFTFKYLR